MKAIHNKERGFTLGELLVVIAIMTILVAVAVGSFIGLIGSGSDVSKQYEKEAVDVAIEAYMDTNLSTTIPERIDAAVITSSDGDAPFSNFLRRLPTQYEYSWTAGGSVTQSGNASAGASGPSLPTPIAQWHFDEGFGGNAADSIGGYDGTILNATWTTDSVSGNALNFDGTGDYVDTSLVATSLTSDYTFEAWVKANGLSTWAGVITSNVTSPSYNGFNLQIGTSQRLAICAMSGGSYTYTRTSWAPTTGVWYHLVGVHDSSTNTNTLYVNGNSEDNDVQAVTMPNVNVMIGKFYCNTNNLYFNGVIDEVAIYDEALSATEVQDLFDTLDPS